MNHKIWSDFGAHPPLNVEVGGGGGGGGGSSPPCTCRGHFSILIRFIDLTIFYFILMIFIDHTQGLKKTCKLVV